MSFKLLRRAGNRQAKSAASRKIKIRLAKIEMQSVGVAEVLLFFQGEHAPGVTRTPDLRIRNPLLYPAELRAPLAGK